jgi:hypothetical protein
VAKEEQRNVEIKTETWKNVGVMAAEMGLTKKEIVGRALILYYQVFKEAQKEN